MEKPHLMESLEPCSDQYSFKKDLRLNAWLGVTIVVYFSVSALNSWNPDWSPLLRGSLALAPLIPGMLYIRSWMRFIRRVDELQRRIQLEAFLFAAMGTVIIETAVSILNAHEVSMGPLKHGLGIGGSFMSMMFLWSVGWAIAKCRYK